ncbi:MAG: Sb-PDE family phosphodiesterase [Saprospiraceae bacterium]
MRPAFILIFLSLFIDINLEAQNKHQHNRAIHFPDVPGYKTIVCDFHQHTIFSDGSVWPDIRIQEALRDSIDAVSMTEHLEYQPHRADVPHPDRNRSHDIAVQNARAYELLVIRGAEITRSMPPGHNNAIFIEDANKLLIEDSIEVFREAKRQGAFTFWNHANWIAQRKDGIARMTPTHEFLIKEGLLHGIEVANEMTYSDEALQIALDYDLAIIGTSDIHGLVDWQFDIEHGGHRPVTLAFATERTEASLKTAFFENRTVAWFNNTLIGREEVLKPLIEACLSIEKANYIGTSQIAEVSIMNDSDVEYILLNKGNYTLHENADVLVLHPNTTTTIQVKTVEELTEFHLDFEVLNAVTAPKQHPNIQLLVEPK